MICIYIPKIFKLNWRCDLESLTKELQITQIANPLITYYKVGLFLLFPSANEKNPYSPYLFFAYNKEHRSLNNVDIWLYCQYVLLVYYIISEVCGVSWNGWKLAGFIFNPHILFLESILAENNCSWKTVSLARVKRTFELVQVEYSLMP